jgi:peptidoglycan hydrolase-like protein with peptidoglycan-binding domain
MKKFKQAPRYGDIEMKRLQLNGSIASNVTLTPEDSLATKETLRTLGLYEVPSEGITVYPDEEMFAGIRRFQKEEGLKVDGIVSKNGPTLRALNTALEGKGNGSGETRRNNDGAQLIDPDRAFDIPELEAELRGIQANIARIKERIRDESDSIRVKALEILLKQYENDLAEVKQRLAIARGEII